MGDARDLNERVILATRLALERIRDRIKDKFDSFKIQTIWWAGNGETSAFDVVYGLFGFKKKYFFGFIPWRKKILLFVINPILQYEFSSAERGAYLYYPEIRNVAEEEFDHYCRVTGYQSMRFFDTHKIFLSQEREINEIKEKFVALPLPSDNYELLVGSKVEELARLERQKESIDQKIAELKAELELENEFTKTAAPSQ